MYSWKKKPVEKKEKMVFFCFFFAWWWWWTIHKKLFSLHHFFQTKQMIFRKDNTSTTKLFDSYNFIFLPESKMIVYERVNIDWVTIVNVFLLLCNLKRIIFFLQFFCIITFLFNRSKSWLNRKQTFQKIKKTIVHRAWFLNCHLSSVLVYFINDFFCFVYQRFKTIFHSR